MNFSRRFLGPSVEYYRLSLEFETPVVHEVIEVAVNGSAGAGTTGAAGGGLAAAGGTDASSSLSAIAAAAAAAKPSSTSTTSSAANPQPGATPAQQTLQSIEDQWRKRASADNRNYTSTTVEWASNEAAAAVGARAAAAVAVVEGGGGAPTVEKVSLSFEPSGKQGEVRAKLSVARVRARLARLEFSRGGNGGGGGSAAAAVAANGAAAASDAAADATSSPSPPPPSHPVAAILASLPLDGLRRVRCCEGTVLEALEALLPAEVEVEVAAEETETGTEEKVEVEGGEVSLPPVPAPLRVSPPHASLRIRCLYLTRCGLTELPDSLCRMTSLRDLRLDGNRLAALPAALGNLSALTRLSADNNALASLPASLSKLSNLRELSLENNRLAAPVVDVTRWSHLRSLQLHGNPLEFLPELTACRALRSLSLGGARLRADSGWTLWHVELAPPPSSGVSGVAGGYLSRATSGVGKGGGRGGAAAPASGGGGGGGNRESGDRGGDNDGSSSKKNAPSPSVPSSSSSSSRSAEALWPLVFRRSSCQHPLLAGALAALTADAGHAAAVARVPSAVQQLALCLLSDDAVVVEQASKAVARVATASWGLNCGSGGVTAAVAVGELEGHEEQRRSFLRAREEERRERRKKKEEEEGQGQRSTLQTLSEGEGGSIEEEEEQRRRRRRESEAEKAAATAAVGAAAIVAAENANKTESAVATGGGGGMSGAASGAFAAVAAAAAAAAAALVSPLSPQPSRKSTTVSETAEQQQGDGSVLAALPLPALAVGAAAAGTTLPPLPLPAARARAPTTAAAATTLDSHLDGGLLSSLKSLLRSSPARHRMRVAGLRLLAALAAAGGGVAAPRLLLLGSETSRRSGATFTVASPPRPSSPLADYSSSSASPPPLSTSVVLGALVSSLASGPDDEAAAAAEAAGNLAIMLAAAAPSPSCSGVVVWGVENDNDNENTSSTDAASSLNSMPPSRAAAASLALSRMRSCGPLIALLRALAVPNGSRGGSGGELSKSKKSTTKKKNKKATTTALQTRGTADAPGRPPAPVPTSPRAMALRALAALGEVAAVDEALYGFHSTVLPSSRRFVPHHLSSLLRPPHRRPRVLSIDGGGMKGLATLRLLRALQSRLGPDERARPLVDAFDLVVGTSTGAILAAALVARRMTLDEVDRMYRNLGAAVFSSFSPSNSNGGSGSGGSGGGVPQGADAVAAAIWGGGGGSAEGEEAAAAAVEASRLSSSPREVGDAAAAAANNSNAAQNPPPSSGWRDNLVRAYHSSTRSMRVAVYGAKHDAALFELYLKHLCVFGSVGAPATALPGDAGDGGAAVASGGKPSSAKPNSAASNPSPNPEDKETDAKAAAACKDDENDHLTAPRSRMIDLAAAGSPRLAVVATLASAQPATPFVFRSYAIPQSSEKLASQLGARPGACHHAVWAALRASSAAPYYLEDFRCAGGADRFQDGATTANNPALVALQEARLLWPDAPPALLVSVGAGAVPRRPRDGSAVVGSSGVGGDVSAATAAAVARSNTNSSSEGGEVSAANGSGPATTTATTTTTAAAAAAAAVPPLATTTVAATPPPAKRGMGSAVMDTGAVLIESATSVRATDEALRALCPLVPGLRYSRLAPLDPRCAMDLDEVDRQKWKCIEAAADEYANGIAKRELDEIGAVLREAWEGEESEGESEEEEEG